MSHIERENVTCALDLIEVAKTLGLRVEPYPDKSGFPRGFRAFGRENLTLSLIWGLRTMSDQRVGSEATMVEGWGDLVYDQECGPNQPRGYMRLSQAVDALIEISEPQAGVVIVIG